MSFLSYYRRSAFLIAATIIALGCGKREQIQSYTVPKDPPLPTAGEVASAAVNDSPSPPSTDPTDRMLAAILPEGQRAWFFKVAGPIAVIDKHADEISKFFATIRTAGDKPLPVWRLPAGWTVGAGNPMRAATIIIPGDKPLELTVTTLGWPGTPEAMLSNINRWRGQMQLPPIGPQQLADTSSEIKVGDAAMTVVDLKGHFQSGGMTPPFASGPPFAGGGAPAPAGGNSATPNLPSNHPPVGPLNSTPPASVAQSSLPKFEAPASWQAAPGGEFSRTAYNITEGSKTARVTVSEFPANAPMIADPLANVNRWRGEIGLTPVDNDSLASVTQPIIVDGETALYMPAIPDTAKAEESAAAQATLAVMVPQGNRVWFFKLKGDRELVAAQQQQFKDFLKSVRFTADRGATDGN